MGSRDVARRRGLLLSQGLGRRALARDQYDAAERGARPRVWSIGRGSLGGSVMCPAVARYVED